MAMKQNGTESMITWSERPELFLGVPSVVLVAEARDRRLAWRGYPKERAYQAEREQFLRLVERVFSSAPGHVDGFGRPFWEGLDAGAEYAATPRGRGNFTLVKKIVLYDKVVVV